MVYSTSPASSPRLAAAGILAGGEKVLGGQVVQKVGEHVARQLAGDGCGGQAGEEDCVICLDAPKTHILAPCGHQCVCGTCAQATGGKPQADVPCLPGKGQVLRGEGV